MLQRFGKIEEAAALKAKLAAQGIPSMVVKEGSAKGTMGLYMPVRIMVSVSDRKKASEIARALTKARVRGSSPLVRAAIIGAGPVLTAAGLFLLFSGTNRIGGVVLLVLGVIALAWVAFAFLMVRTRARM